jgi:hypothetical protein
MAQEILSTLKARAKIENPVDYVANRQEPIPIYGQPQAIEI